VILLYAILAHDALRSALGANATAEGKKGTGRILKLTEREIEEKVAAAKGWSREDGKWIVKKYRFGTFLEGIAFVNRVADAAERFNHHPFISIDYKLVTLRMTSWHAGGLTELDFSSAAAFDREHEEFL
jgi:4a-hydroxytetrahydrobiopterin dehydratase